MQPYVSSTAKNPASKEGIANRAVPVLSHASKDATPPWQSLGCAMRLPSLAPSPEVAERRKLEGRQGSFLRSNWVFVAISDIINYTTVDPKQFVFFKIETRACDVQSWETNVKDCKAETDTAVQSGRTHLKKEVRSPNSKPFGELFFKREHDAGHAAQSAGS